MIKFKEIAKNREYRERIIKYFRLPMRISVSEEKFLSDLEFLKYTNPELYNTVIKFTEHDFNKEALEQKTSTPDFTMEHILEPIIDMIKENPRWQSFLRQDNSDVLANFNGIDNPHKFYVEKNNGKHFVSIDLVSANWQSLQSIVGIEGSYEELIVKYTENLIPPISKTFRTKITGMLGAKSIMDYNKKLLLDNKESILKAIYEKTEVDLRGQEPFAFYADEFLIEVDVITKNKLNSLNIGELEQSVYKDTGVKIHIRPFTFHWLGIDKGCAKIYKNDKYEILNVSKDTLLIFNKLIHDLIPGEIDFEKIKLKGKTHEWYINIINHSIKSIKHS